MVRTEIPRVLFVAWMFFIFVEVPDFTNLWRGGGGVGWSAGLKTNLVSIQKSSKAYLSGCLTAHGICFHSWRLFGGVSDPIRPSSCFNCNVCRKMIVQIVLLEESLPADPAEEVSRPDRPGPVCT